MGMVLKNQYEKNITSSNDLKQLAITLGLLKLSQLQEHNSNKNNHNQEKECNDETKN